MDQKKALFFLLITLVLFPLYAQQAKDVVLIVDTSSAMFSYYNDVGSYLSGSFFTENLNLGDTLHIISYNNKPRLEIARRILGQGDMEAVSARIWLLYPLFPGPDPFAALNYAVTYVHSIPGGRSKNVFIVSGDDLSAQINAYAARFGAHTDISFIRASYNMSRNAIQHVSASGTNITQGRTGPDSGVLSRPIAETGNMAITTPDMVSAAPAGSPVNTPGKELTDANDVKNEINLPVTVELSEKNAVSSFGDFSFALPLLTAGGILFLLILILAAPKIFLPGIKNFHTSLNKAMADKRTVSGKLQNSRSATVSIKTAITKTIAAKSAAIKPVMAKPNSGTKISVNSPVVKRSGNSSKSLIAFLKILFSKKPRIKNNFPVMRVPAS
ncbi:MAG: VWA domain-containing protein, partial [Treponema sp.]|nr:VWA domain-containing protein [Treponema sp.]